MKLLDTVVLVGALREDDKHHKKCMEHLSSLQNEDAYIPSTSLLEFDLAMKIRGFTDEERKITWEDMAALIPHDKVLPLSTATFIKAAELGKMSYFDALITALTEEFDAVVITTDEAIRRETRWEW